MPSAVADLRFQPTGKHQQNQYLWTQVILAVLWHDGAVCGSRLSVACSLLKPSKQLHFFEKSPPRKSLGLK